MLARHVVNDLLRHAFEDACRRQLRIAFAGATEVATELSTLCGFGKPRGIGKSNRTPFGRLHNWIYRFAELKCNRAKSTGKRVDQMPREVWPFGRLVQ